MADLSLLEAYANHPIISTITNKIKSLFDFLNPLDTIDIVKEYNNKQPRIFPPSTKDYFIGLAKEIGEKKLEHLSDGLSIFNVIAPSLYYRATKEAQINGFNWRRFGNSVLNGNSGFVDPVTAEEHPIRTAFINAVGDVAVSSPKSVVNLAKAVVKQGVKRPPISPALAIASTNEVIPTVVPATVPLEVNAISAIPAINNGTKPYMAFSKVTELPRSAAPTYLGSWYPYKVSHEDELPGFLDMIQELAGGKAPISLTTGLTSYAMRKPPRQFTNSERPNNFNGINTVFWRKNPETITVGDLAYGLAHNLPGWNRQAYKGILKDTGKINFDYEEAARSLMYDVKAQLYKKLAAQKGGPLTAEEFADGLWDLKKSDFLNAFNRAHDGMYRRDIPLSFDINNLDVLKDIPRIINLLTQYKNGGKFYKESTQFNKLS